MPDIGCERLEAGVDDLALASILRSNVETADAAAPERLPFKVHSSCLPIKSINIHSCLPVVTVPPPRSL